MPGMKTPTEAPVTGAGLKKLRTQLGWTQPKFADELGISLRAYCDLEANRSRLRKVYQLAIRQILQNANLSQPEV